MRHVSAANQVSLTVSEKSDFVNHRYCERTPKQHTKSFAFFCVDPPFLFAAHHVSRGGASECGGEEDESGARARDPQRRRRPSRHEAQRPRPRRLQRHHGKRNAPRTRRQGAATSRWHGPETWHGLRARLWRPRRRSLYYPAPLRRAPPRSVEVVSCFSSSTVLANETKSSCSKHIWFIFGFFVIFCSLFALECDTACQLLVCEIDKTK